MRAVQDFLGSSVMLPHVVFNEDPNPGSRRSLHLQGPEVDWMSWQRWKRSWKSDSLNSMQSCSKLSESRSKLVAI